MNDTLTSPTSCRTVTQQLEHADTLQPTRLSGKDLHGSCPSSHSLPPMHNWTRCFCRPNLAWTLGLHLDAPTRRLSTRCKVIQCSHTSNMLSCSCLAHCLLSACICVSSHASQLCGLHIP
jgi:hypothetical protein